MCRWAPGGHRGYCTPLPGAHDSSLGNWIWGQGPFPALPSPWACGPGTEGVKGPGTLPGGGGHRELSRGALSGLIIQAAYLFHSSCEADRLSWQGGREARARLMAGRI